jgi:uncharacterized protein YutE (UPF0331/DUF86 family)
MTDDIILNKAASIERCLHRVQEEFEGHEEELETNFTRQDAIVLNLIRACETSIDLAMHVSRIKALGLPQSSRDAFDLLAKAEIITKDMAAAMKRMVGFRNIAVHEYRNLDTDILKSIVEQRLDDFTHFTASVLKK